MNSVTIATETLLNPVLQALITLVQLPQIQEIELHPDQQMNFNWSANREAVLAQTRT